MTDNIVEFPGKKNKKETVQKKNTYSPEEISKQHRSYRFNIEGMNIHMTGDEVLQMEKDAVLLDLLADTLYEFQRELEAKPHLAQFVLAHLMNLLKTLKSAK